MPSRRYPLQTSIDIDILVQTVNPESRFQDNPDNKIRFDEGLKIPDAKTARPRIARANSLCIAEHFP